MVCILRNMSSSSPVARGTEAPLGSREGFTETERSWDDIPVGRQKVI